MTSLLAGAHQSTNRKKEEIKEQALTIVSWQIKSNMYIDKHWILNTGISKSSGCLDTNSSNLDGLGPQN